MGSALLFIVILLMGMRVFFTKNGRFPSLHISDSEPLQERGIHCATSQDTEMNRKESPVVKILKTDKILISQK